MDIKQIRKIFENCEKGEIEVYHAKALEIQVIMQNYSEITILCGETEFIDLTNENPNSYVGFGSTLISPTKDIRDIKVKWR